MRKIASALLLIVLLAARSNSGQSQSGSAATQPRAETQLSKTVVRITGKIQDVPQPLNATGFVVGVADSRLPGRIFTYLVTNRHVAEAIFPGPDDKPVSHRILEMKAILNLKDPIAGTRAHSIPLPPEMTNHWYFPEDRSVDLALISIPMENTYDVIYVDQGTFLTPDLWDKFRIVPGDKVLTCGYFLHYAGAHQFQPIIREGSLAMVPDDAMPVPIGGKAKVYLADLHIIPGNSGSPLFLAPSFTLGGYVTGSDGGIPYGLLGIVSAYMWEDNQLTLRAATDFEGTIHANSGIAMIVPVEELKNLLYRVDVQHLRDNAVANFNKANP